MGLVTLLTRIYVTLCRYFKVSDHTFYLLTESDYCGKIPEYLAESLCFRRYDQKKIWFQSPKNSLPVILKLFNVWIFIFKGAKPDRWYIIIICTTGHPFDILFHSNLMTRETKAYGNCRWCLPSAGKAWCLASLLLSSAFSLPVTMLTGPQWEPFKAP